MKIIFFGPANSIHTVRWVNALRARGMDIVVLSLSSDRDVGNAIPPEIKVKYVSIRTSRFKPFFAGFAARRILKKESYDVANAHYISTYGVMACIVGARPLILSVWGKDVYDYPARSRLRLFVTRSILRRADRIASTSHVMADQVRRLLKQPNKQISVTPFGVDTKLFAYQARSPRNKLVIGIVKTLEQKYGIEYLIRAFALLLKNHHISLELQICGRGSQRESLERLSTDLGISEHVHFLGFIPNQQLPAILYGFDVFCAPSVDQSESFGVAVVEAMACGLPCVTSDVDGFREVMDDGVTGYIVPRKDDQALADKLAVLIQDESLRVKMGKNGRARVEALYDWQKNVDVMISLYQETTRPKGSDEVGA